MTRVRGSYLLRQSALETAMSSPVLDLPEAIRSVNEILPSICKSI
jgi:hypothetical protein